jgi:hypothetical protein
MQNVLPSPFVSRQYPVKDHGIAIAKQGNQKPQHKSCACYCDGRDNRGGVHISAFQTHSFAKNITVEHSKRKGGLRKF